MLKHVSVLTADRQSRISSKTGKPFEFIALQGVMVYDDGRQEVFVYDFFAARGEPLPTITPGKFLPVLEPKPNNMTRKLEANIVALRPVETGKAA